MKIEHRVHKAHLGGWSVGIRDPFGSSWRWSRMTPWKPSARQVREIKRELILQQIALRQQWMAADYAYVCEVRDALDEGG